MMPGLDAVGLGAALLAGLAASGHCLGMCGGIAGALAVRAQRTGEGSRLAAGLAYNLARITSYALAGAIAGLVGHAVLHTLNIAALSLVFRGLAGLIMLAAAGRLLFGWRLLDPIEAAGARLWGRIAPRAGRQGRSGGLTGAVGLGLAWGWMPCGMTYSMLMLSATTASAAGGAAVMLAFGAGTLPAMVTATIAFEQVAGALARRATFRRVAGVGLLAFGLWTAGSAAYHGLAGGGHAHHMMTMPAEAPMGAPPGTPAAPAEAPIPGHEHHPHD
ncbi:MAG TPA: sulfite exporter TauE/SafE family protein [Steroidobacteraceae bacterium]|nr:sulfite exporter TauE/SafE family protein [Steroidobacteraceae bacterium]